MGLYKVESHGQRKIKNVNLGAFPLNALGMKTQWSLCCNGHFLEHLSDMGQTMYTCWVTVILRRIRFKAGLACVSCLDWRICSCTIACSEVTWCPHESLAAMHQPLDTYFQTDLLETASREGGPLLSQIRNCENWTMK